MVAATAEVSAAPSNLGGARTVLLKVWRNYVFRRILRSIFVIWVVATAVFFMVRLLPGNPVQVYINTQISQYGMSYADAAASASSYFSFNPTTPLAVQYLDYIVGLLHGDLGISIATRGVPVSDIIARYLPWTLFSVGIGLVISVVIGLLLGMIMAYRRGGFIDHAVTALGSILHAIPNYIMAIMIVVILGAELGIYDVGASRGTYTAGVQPSFSLTFLSDILYHATMPILTYVLTTVGTWALVMKSSTTQILEEDYVMVARARGLSDGRVRGAYVGRNAVLPLVAQIATQAGFVVGGAIFVETTFNYTGIGASLYAALQTRDYTVLQGILLIVTVTVVAANLIADLIYSVLDPRIRTDETGE